MEVFTIGHGQRPAQELVDCLLAAGVSTLVDVRRYPGSRRNPQFGQAALAAALEAAGIAYRHAVELGGRLTGEPEAERFACLDAAAFSSYAARMGTQGWQEALAEALALRRPCLMCAETVPWRCHRNLIADLLTARGHGVFHLIRPHEVRCHRLSPQAEARDGRLYLCGSLVA